MNIGGATRLLLRPLCCRYSPNTKDKHEESKFTLAAVGYVPCCYAMLINPIRRSKQLHAVASLLLFNCTSSWLCYVSIATLEDSLFSCLHMVLLFHHLTSSYCAPYFCFFDGADVYVLECLSIYLTWTMLKKKKKNSDNKFLLTITWLEKSEIGELIADRESHVSESLSLRQIICSVTSVDNTIRHKIECAEARKLVCRAISFLMLFPQSWRHRVYSPTNALNI